MKAAEAGCFEGC